MVETKEIVATLSQINYFDLIKKQKKIEKQKLKMIKKIDRVTLSVSSNALMGLVLESAFHPSLSSRQNDQDNIV